MPCLYFFPQQLHFYENCVCSKVCKEGLKMPLIKALSLQCTVLCLQWKHTSILKESHRYNKKKNITYLVFSYFEEE